MPSDLSTQAIKAALTSNWQEAIKTNLGILKEVPEDVETLNRLARAYKESGQADLSQKTYRKVLRIDRFNPIAIRNLKLFETSKRSFSGQNHLNNGGLCQPTTFLEEPGKTKIVSLINLAPTSLISSLSCGKQASLQVKRRAVTVISLEGVYLGALPDDLSAKLIKFIKGGSRYEVFIKNVGRNCLSVLLREVYRSPRFKNQPSFPSNEAYVPNRPENVRPDDDFASPQTDSLSEEEGTEEPLG